MLKNKCNLFNIYIVLVIMSILYSITFFFLNDTESFFLIGKSPIDPGNDLYLSINFSHNLDPYEYTSLHFPYTPITVLFLYFLQFFVHQNFALKTKGMEWNTANTYFENIFEFKMLNLLFAIISILLLMLLFINYLIKSKKFTINYSFVVSVCIIFNIGFICALARGNLIIGALLFIAFFVLMYDNDVKSTREIALLSLAIAFNIKPYVAIFGFLLLYKKMYKEAIRTTIYALFLFILPFFVLKGGFIYNFCLFFKSLSGFGKESFSMIGLNSFINLCLKILNKLFNISISLNICNYFIAFAFNIFLLLFSFNKMKNWQHTLILTLIMFMASNNYGYVLCFLSISLICFLCEENKLNILNIAYFVSFCFLLLPIQGIKYHIIIDNILIVLLSIFIVFHIVLYKNTN